MLGQNTKGSFSSRFPRWAAGVIILCGLLVEYSWYAHWQKILQLVPETAPMQFNTALCFIFCGAGLFLLTTTRARVAPWLGGVVMLFAAATLSEYITGFDLHLDQLFFKPYFEAATTYPGRMSPLAAVCFILLGISLMLSGAGGKWVYWLTITGLLTCIVGVIASVALVGFAFGIVAAYGWGASSSMAVNTAALFLLLSAGQLVQAWRAARQESHEFIRWLPVTGSLALMMMVAFVAVGDMQGLQAAMYWRKHTIQVILTAQSFENDLIDLQRGMRGYVTTGDTNALASFQNATGPVAGTLDKLADLTRDNPAQKQKLMELEGAIKDLLAYDNQLIEAYRRQGAEIVFKLDSAGQGRKMFGTVHDLLKVFTENEQKLLDQRDASEEVGFHNTERLLVVGCVLAAALLLLANYMTNRELARRRLTEMKLARQADALRRSNAELEQFAYVASHDMREPLRAVSGFAQILRRNHQDKLDEKAVQTIDRIVDGARRMANIIDDLLVLSGIGSKKERFEKKPLEKPLKQALENLSVAITERAAVVRHDPLPELPVDGSQITLLFQNLIGNGIKFCDGRAPEIHVGAVRETDGVWRISVRDNGIGIEAKHFGKIFGIFQRLHSRSAYSGTGIGLAICKKIVERHGGRIWLESTPGNGTTFYFTLTGQARENYDIERTAY